MIRLNILDQCPIPQGTSTAQALANALELARLADSCGYYRVWYAEHHQTPALACNSPEVMIGPVASATKRIRVGSGGVMLPHYSPLKVAEVFGMLDGLAPGRIDLGVGRAPGTSAKVSRLLQRDRRAMPPNDFPQQLDELLHHIEGSSIEPGLLGSSPESSLWAAERGLPYIFADFINPTGEPYAALYREHFQPCMRLPKTRVSVCVWAVCAETDEEALRQSLSARMMLLHLFRGQFIAVPPVDVAAEFLASEGFPVEEQPAGRRMLYGSPARLREKIEAVAQDYGADEVFVVNIVYDHQARLKSYELLAKAFALH